MNASVDAPTTAIRRDRIWFAALATALALLACGGGDSGPGAAPPSGLTPTTGRVSADGIVAAACTGGGDGTGTLYANAEVEPSLAISSSNPQQLLAAWQQDRWSDGGARALVSAASSDGGISWTRTLHPMSRCGGAAPGSSGDFERASDPWVGIGSDGTLHVMALAFSGAVLGANGSSAMLASRSTDGGRNWSTPQALVLDGATFFNDKNTLTVDALDPRYVYAVWDRLDAAGNGPTLLARSTDAGLSWEPAREIYRPPPPADGTAQTIGNLIVVLPAGPQRGMLVNLFTQIDVSAGSTSNTVRVVRSADQGLSWGAAVTVGEHRGVGALAPGTQIPIRDGGIIASIAAGPDGTLWVAWQDSRFSGGRRDAIVVSRSIDGGSTWSPPVAASNSGIAAAFTPTLHVRADGLAGLLYFDLRPDTADPTTLLAATWLATSRDGSSWTDTAVWNRFDMAQAPNARGLFLGDYMGLVSSGNQFLPLVVLSSTDLLNRTDVYLMHVTPGTAAVATPAQPPLALSDAEFQARRAAFTQRVMERRVPDWGRRVGLQAARSRPP